LQPHYNLNWKKLTHDGWANELSNKEYDVTGTLKFHNGRRIGKATANKLLTAYWHKLDRMFFGRQAKKGVGIERWVFGEYGELGDNLHYHFKAKSPTEPVFFCAVANTLWSNFDQQTASPKFNEITPTIDSKNSARYVTKSTKHFFFDEVGFKASHRNKRIINYKDFQTISQAKRIENQISIDEIRQAMCLVEDQIEQAKYRIKIRQQKSVVLGAR
jgi:hypothetical protein